ncbi:MAG TPA: Rab family GTPase [Candidatus Lokiarchaeia archaeon]|nr:Rab family GTPase [Candidatus Lokiarchaeia archaeon]
MAEENFKVVLTGNESVGKTSLIRRVVQNEFDEKYKPTLGFDLSLKYLDIDTQSIVFSIWDLGGQMNFAPLRKNYYQGAQGFLLVFSVADALSFKNLHYWVQEIKASCPDAPIVLVANKADKDEWQVTLEEIEQKCTDLGLNGNAITSAKTGEGIETAFEMLGRLILSWMKSMINQ